MAGTHELLPPFCVSGVVAGRALPRLASTKGKTPQVSCRFTSLTSLYAHVGLQGKQPDSVAVVKVGKSQFLIPTALLKAHCRLLKKQLKGVDPLVCVNIHGIDSETFQLIEYYFRVGETRQTGRRKDTNSHRHTYTQTNKEHLRHSVLSRPT